MKHVMFGNMYEYPYPYMILTMINENKVIDLKESKRSICEGMREGRNELIML